MIDINDFNFEEIDNPSLINSNGIPCEKCVIKDYCDSDQLDEFETEVDKKFGKSSFPACMRFKITKKDENSNN